MIPLPLEENMSETQTREYLINRIVDKLTEFYMAEHDVSLQQAMQKIYSSRTYDLLQAPGSFLTSQSPDYIYELLKAE